MAQPIYALGRNEKLFVVPESTFGTAASAPASGNAMKFRECSFTQAIERVFREDKRTTRSYLDTIQRRKSVNWSVGGYLLPSGSLGVAPDGWDDIFEAGFGTETINASTSVVYTLAKDFEKSLTFHRAVGTSAAQAVFAEMVTGAVVNQIQFNLSGSDEARVSASGMAVEILRAGTSVVVTDSGTSLAVTAGHGSKFDAGVYLDVHNTNDNLVSAVATDTLTIAAHTAGTAGQLVVPSACVKSQTFASGAKPISGVLGSCTLEGSALELISADITISNGVQMHNDKYGVDYANGFHLGNRSVTGNLSLRLNDANFATIAKTRRNTLIALSLVSGTASGSIATFSLSNVLIDYTAIPSSASEDIIVSLPFKAYGSSGEDEVTLTLT